MSDILIDVSYLISSYRSFRGKATCKADIVNFYRILAELVAHKTIYIKVNKHGPVYEKASEAVEFFRASSKGQFEIQQLDTEKIVYSDLVKKVALAVEGINLKNFFSDIKHKEDVSPEFTTEHHPDISFHEWLIKGKKNLPGYIENCNDGTYVPILIAHKLGLNNIFKKIDKTGWQSPDSIALAAKMRSLLYIQMAKTFGLTYIPSATRGYNAKFDFKSPSLRNLLFEDAKSYKDFKRNFQANANVISGLIVRNECVPAACLNDALDLRIRTSNLRKSLDKKSWLKKGDALITHQYAKINELKNIIQEYTKEGKLVFDVDDLNPTLSADSVSPAVEVTVKATSGVLKIVDFMRRKKLVAKTMPLILPIMQFNFSQPSEMLKLLKQNAGLK